MRVLKTVLVMSSLVVAAACQRDARPAELDRQLTWLDSLVAQPATPTATASALELGMHPTLVVAQAAPAVEEAAPKAAATERRTSSPRRSSSARRSSGGSSAGSSSGTYRREPRVVEVKHTRRDAVIGAGAGAVIGAVAGGPRHRVRGAIIGAAVGGVAGAVIGNNVDKTRRIEP